MLCLCIPNIAHNVESVHGVVQTEGSGYSTISTLVVKVYVDCTQSLKKTHSQEFTDHLNSVDDDIKWTTEWEVVTDTEMRGEIVMVVEDVSVTV